MRTLNKFLTALLLSLVAAPLMAQTLTGSVVGTVTDEQGGALPGVTVTLTGKTGAKTMTSDSSGQFRFAAVDPGTYDLRVELASFQPQRKENLVVGMGKQIPVDFTLKVSGLAETLEVVGEAPVVDVTSTQSTNSLSQELLFNMPIDRRSFNMLNFAPGINNDSAFGGAAAYGNGLLLDGVDTRDPEAGSAWTFFNYNIIDEVQVGGLGAPAEYGAFTGALLNTISKSGGNHHSALFDIYYTNDSLAGDNITTDISTANPTLTKPNVTTSYTDITGQLSGPIIKDKLFFFLSAQRFYKTEDPAGPRTVREEISPRFNGKLTWQATSNDNLTLALQVDDYNIKGRPGYPGGFSSGDQQTVEEDAPEIVWNLQWRHLFGSKTFIEAKYVGWWGYFDLNPKDPSPVHFDGATGGYSGGGGYYYYADRGRNQVNASVTHYAEAFGKHDVKFGVEIERSKVRSRYGYMPNGYYYDYDGPYLRYEYSYDIEGNNGRNSVYLQDSWKPTSRLTVNAGVRFDQAKGASPDLGDETVFNTKSWAPRIGFAFDVTGDHKTVLKAHYGRYYEGAFFLQYAGALPGIGDFVGYDAITGEEVSRGVKPLYSIDPDLKHPRVDEYTAGFERALSADFRLAVTGIWRDNKNFISSVYPTARWTPNTVTNPLTGGPLTVYRWANPDESETNVLITNPDGFVYRDPSGNILGTAEASRRYQGLMLVLSKRYTHRWQAQVSYVLSKTEGTVDPDSAVSYGQGRQFQTPTLALVNAKGEAAVSRRHEVKAYLSYMIPAVETSVNAYFRSITGRNYTLYQRYPSSQINFPPSSGGRQPNLEPPGTRHLKTENLLDLRLEKVFKVGGGNDKIGLYADIVNVFNSSLITTTQTRVPSADIGGYTVDYEGPRAVTPARQVTLGARWSF